MKHKVMTTMLALVLVAGFAASVASAQNQDLHGSGYLSLTKKCPKLATEGYCSVTTSYLEAIPVGSKIYYVTGQAMTKPPISDQPVAPTPIPPNMLDSNIVLYVSPGNWAVGRCTLDYTTPFPFTGLCTLSGGAGQFAGFHARVDVSFEGGWKWEGTYSFNPEQSRR